jgi:hypothetical protein
MNHSFSECTEAITHDSDPKFLTFERLSTNPEFQAGEGHVVSVIGQELSLSTIETGDGPFEAGPTVGDLTDGTGNVVSLSVEPPVLTRNLIVTDGSPVVTLADLVDGEFTITFHFTDSSTLVVTKTAAEIRSYAIAQGVGGSSVAYVSFPQSDLTSVIGKTLGNATYQTVTHTTVPFTASVSMNAHTSKVTTIYPGSSNFVDLTNGFPTRLDGTLDVGWNTNYQFQTGDHLRLYFTLVGAPTVGGDLSVSFVLDNAAVLGPLHVTATALRAIAASKGTLDETHITVSSTELGWDLSYLANRTIVSIEYSLTNVFAANGSYSMGNGSSIQIQHTDTLSPITSPGTWSHPVSMSGWGSNIPDLQIDVDWRSNFDDFELLVINLAATDILSKTLIGQLPLQNADIDFTGLISSFIATHVGWTIAGVESASMSSNYGPASIEEPSLFELTMVVPIDDSEVRHLITNIDPLDVSGSFDPVIGRNVITTSTRIELRIALFSEDEPGVYGSNVVTHPYEIRQRNLPLFKFRLYDGRLNQETPLTFDVLMFGSQGTPGVDKNLLREWCIVPMDVLTNAGLSLGNASKAINVDQHYPGLPDNFGGAAIYPAKEVVNPWNYIRFVIKPTQGKVNADYNNCYLTITANARELL